jgi:TRAP-type uncharacterized transport system substrate-binding protein
MGACRTILLGLGLVHAALAAQAQDEPRTYQQQRTTQHAYDVYREQVNENVLFLMGGQPGGSYMELAYDISLAVDDGLRLRVIPVIGNAAVQNVSDVLFLRGIDLALTTVQVLNHLKQTRQYGPNLPQQMVYVAALSNDEMHVVARPGITAIEELKGKRVNFHNAGSATALLGPRIFKDLQIDVQPVYMPQSDALERMRSGEVAATVCICAKPLDILSAGRDMTGFHLLDVPFVPGLQDEYLPASIGHDDYPLLLAKGGKIETIATTTVLVSFNWPRGSPRYNRTAKFVEALFSKLPELQRPPRHPAWKSVNLAATVPGLQRFPAAQEWLDHHEQSASLRAGAGELLVGSPGSKTDAAASVDTDALFREFMDFTRRSRK